jgi:hypothetical protein
MSRKIFLFLLIILSLLTSNFVLAMPLPFTAALNTVTTRITTSNGIGTAPPQHPDSIRYATADVTSEAEPATRNQRRISTSILETLTNITKKTTNTNHNHNLSARTYDLSTRTDKSSNATYPQDPNTNNNNIEHDKLELEEEGKWYHAPWVSVATWVLWLYIIAVVLGLLALWGRGMIDRSGEWINVGGVRVDEEMLRRMGVL